MKKIKKAKKNGMVKFDQQKINLELIALDTINEMAKVLTFGKIKYTARNWELSGDWSRAFGALLRHLFRWWQGQDKDPETGLSHLTHAMCCLHFLATWELRETGIDDRPKLSPKVLAKMDDMSFMDNAIKNIKKPKK